ncbi:UbiX family flavin prenyltransferase [Clostridia bacterium OttesenSCG-928-O13]|nr:UbiX family flavin prenyltransferase [Clostridia bacterium OttesenSCG-928-O13]
MKITVAITGASGVIYGVRLLEALAKSGQAQTHFVMSAAAEDNIRIETGYAAGDIAALADRHYRVDDMTAAIASGSFPMDAMVVLPCSMKTLAAIAHGYAGNLIARAADVTIKEGRKLILCPRETPFSAIHLSNMLELARIGVCILPPVPGFYQKPQSIDDLIAHHTMKVFDQLNLPFPDVTRWGDPVQGSS